MTPHQKVTSVPEFMLPKSTVVSKLGHVKLVVGQQLLFSAMKETRGYGRNFNKWFVDGVVLQADRALRRSRSRSRSRGRSKSRSKRRSRSRSRRKSRSRSKRRSDSPLGPEEENEKQEEELQAKD